MQCVIIDDNPIARETISFLANQVSDLTVLCEFSSAVQAYEYLQQNSVELLFLDIEMPELSGLDLTRNLAGRCPVIIFTTSKKEYALEAFDLNVADYLIKPILPARFLLALDKARELLSSRSYHLKWNRVEFVFLRDTSIIRRVDLGEICYVEAMGDYVKVFTEKKCFVIHSKLRTVEERLPRERFLRVHRSYIIALDKIEYMQESTVRICEKFIPIADSYRKNLSMRMNVL